MADRVHAPELGRRRGWARTSWLNTRSLAAPAEPAGHCWPRQSASPVSGTSQPRLSPRVSEASNRTVANMLARIRHPPWPCSIPSRRRLPTPCAAHGRSSMPGRGPPAPAPRAGARCHRGTGVVIEDLQAKGASPDLGTDGEVSAGVAMAFDTISPSTSNASAMTRGGTAPALNACSTARRARRAELGSGADVASRRAEESATTPGTLPPLHSAHRSPHPSPLVTQLPVAGKALPVRNQRQSNRSAQWRNRRRPAS